MIDWVTAKLPCNNKLRSGCVAKLDADGNVEWLTQSFMSVEGSHESSVGIKSLTPQTIQISGNPAKWLQGHNLFGTNDLKTLMALFFSRLYEAMAEEGLNPTIEQCEAVEKGIYTVSRIDINETWFLNNQYDVKAWIRAAGSKVSMPHRGKGVFSGDTLYWGKGSKYYSLKCYSKGDEINGKKSNFPDALRTPQMLEYADRALRLELTLCSKALREWHLNMPCNWTLETPKMLLLQVVRSLDMSNNFKLSDKVLDSLPRKLRTYYKLWLYGEDLRQEMSRPTFYRVRKQLQAYDIDIALVRDVDKPADNVIPLIRVLEAEPVGIPDWAIEQGLVACA
ncbi:phage/plasmid replication protein, II/X family [Psychrobacter celer]|uniref:phage/plasmid replication protein, II/X family n=1 Tax=Psychrobacter celer TaxID=306572 RepID=UPI003FD326DF